MFRAVSLPISFVLAGCVSSLPTPQMAQHSPDSFREVPYPPPAALAETVPPRPDEGDVVWVDGEWVFGGGRYVWRRGGWVKPPPKSSYAPWRSRYESDGRLMLAPGTWYDASGQSLSETISPVVPAYTPPNQLTSESQTGR